MDNKLYRCQTEKMLGGVCCGLAKYLSIDVTIVRLFFVIFTLLGGVGPLIYIILWVILPQESGTGTVTQPLNADEFKERAEQVRDEFVNAVREPNQKTLRYVGVALVLVGFYFFVKQLNLPWLAGLDTGVLWAGLILVAGIALLVWAFRKGN